MWSRFRTQSAIALELMLVGCAHSPARIEPGEAATDLHPSDAAFEWFAFPIEVTGLPSDAEFVPVSCAIDFSEVLQQLNIPGAADERSLRLYRLSPAGPAVEEPVQFSANAQLRPKVRPLLSGTRESVSYAGEYAAGDTPDIPNVAGQLTWIVRASDSALRTARPARSPGVRYRLEFAIARRGRLVQVPFPPQNLRGFDDAGRATPVRWFPRMQIHPQWPLAGAVQIFDDRQLVTSYHPGPTPAQAGAPSLAVRRPFFYPVNGPDGISLTEFGKPHDPTGSHAHHYSLWIAHASVDGQDFWSEKGGIIAHEQFELMEDGPVFCRWAQTTRWLSNRTEWLHERRRFTVYARAESDDFRLIDVDLEWAPPGPKPVTLGKTSFGFLATRVAQSMTVFDGGGEILNANGDRNERGAHLKRAAWIDQSGPIAPGQWGGIAIFDHPANQHHPTVWHCRDDGWAGAAFNAESAYTLQPAAKLRLRYRICLHRRDATGGNVARRYQEYSAEPTVRLGAAIRGTK